MTQTSRIYADTPSAEPAPRKALRRSLVTQRVAEEDISDSLIAEWEALHSQLTPNTPFTSPQWNLLWWKHHRADSLSARDTLFLIVVRDARGNLIAVAPMMSTDRPSIGPLRVRVLRCFGADPNVTELRSLICQPEDQLETLEAIRSYVKRVDGRWDWIEWGALREENWAQAAHASQPGATISSQEIGDYYLPLPDTWEALRSSRSRNIKESIRKCYNSLKRDGHTPVLRVVRSPEDVADALDTFHRLHSGRSQVSGTVTHANVFKKQLHRDFLADYSLAMAQADRLRIFQLVIGDRVVATRIGYQLGDELYLYYSGYDFDWSKYSVMTTLVVEALKWAIEERLKIVNLSTGTDVSKLRWSPAVAGYRTLVEIRPGWRAGLSFKAYRQLRRLTSKPNVPLPAGSVNGKPEVER